MTELTVSDLLDPVHLLFAPLVAREYAEQWLPAYADLDGGLERLAAADLIVVDGPPRALGGREGVLYQLHEFAHPGTVVVFDDSERADVRKALRRWKQNLGHAVVIRRLDGFQKGLSCALIRKPIRPSDLAQHRARLTVRELERHIPPPHRFVLLDGDRLTLPRAVEDRRDRLHVGTVTGDWPPVEGTQVTARLRELARSRTVFLAMAWPAFWWRQHFRELADYLRFCVRVRSNARLMLFRLTGSPSKWK
jgi:hypothetical protein